MKVYLDSPAFMAESSLYIGGVFSCHSTAIYLWTFSLLGYNKIHYNLNKNSNKLQKLTFVCFAAGVILSKPVVFTIMNLNLKAERGYFCLFLLHTQYQITIGSQL